MRFAVETKLIKFAVETKLRRLGTEIKGRIEEANSFGSIKLLMYCSRPRVVERRFWVEIKFKRFGVETKFVRLAVETTPVILETYPEVPRPPTVEANWVSR